MNAQNHARSLRRRNQVRKRVAWVCLPIILPLFLIYTLGDVADRALEQIFSWMDKFVNWYVTREDE